MTHKIQSVKPLDNCVIEAIFISGVVKQFDIKKLYPVFPQLKDFETIPMLFEQVQVDTGGYGVSWNDELDLNSEDIWEDGIETGRVDNVDINNLLATNILEARDKMAITQKQLSENTGIYQADISKIERGIGNPSLSTLKRLADGMGMILKIEFEKNG